MLSLHHQPPTAGSTLESALCILLGHSTPLCPNVSGGDTKMKCPGWIRPPQHSQHLPSLPQAGQRPTRRCREGGRGPTTQRKGWAHTEAPPAPKGLRSLLQEQWRIGLKRGESLWWQILGVRPHSNPLNQNLHFTKVPR